MGDFLRGVNVNELPQSVARGVQNHQAVDRFTDSHDALKQLKTNFSAQRRRFAGIIIDVAFDYFLIKHWRSYSDESLAGFTAYCYLNLEALQELMPSIMRQKVNWMIQTDLLNSYAKLQGVGHALDGMSRRMRFENRLAGAIEEVESHYTALEQVFLIFFSELCTYIHAEKIEDYNIGMDHS